MPENKLVYTSDFKVRSYEVDGTGQSTLTSIANYFQEAAGQHASELGVDIADLRKKGLTWILFKLQISVNRFPERWEALTVRTWTSIQGSLRAYRDYQLLDTGGNVIASGLSHWMMLDWETRSPVKIPESFQKLPLKNDERAMKPHKGKVKILPNENARFITTVGPNDADLNGHANNVRYVYWITNILRRKNGKNLKCNEITIQYMAEAVPGDVISLSEGSENRSEIYTLYKKNSDSAIATAQTKWG